MTLSNKSGEVERIKTSFGPCTPMDSHERHDALHSTSVTSQTNILGEGNQKRRRRVKGLLRIPLFLSQKNKRAQSLASPTGSTKNKLVAVTPPPTHRAYHRRMSRLDLNEPIEDVFSGINFATMEENFSRRPSDDDTHSNEDVIEDPDAIIASLLQEQCSVKEEKNS
ncbi:unnamed protein product [Clavelina lepadiformis]|uniref:Uncharacterized protein n=1 Tax=Clavelina lepadiformis TaxID=159417 RepID=A0ABP0GVN7_CLALP